MKNKIINFLKIIAFAIFVVFFSLGVFYGFYTYVALKDYAGL